MQKTSDKEIVIVQNDKEHAIFHHLGRQKRGGTSGAWFNHDCSDTNLSKELGRPKEKIRTIKFDDGLAIADILHVYF